MKKLFTSAFIIATIALGAQNQKMKKACIKMESDDNGKVVKIDTCVTAATDEELQQKLSALGLGSGNLPEIPEINIQIDSLPGDGNEVTMTKVIVVDDGEAGSKKSGKAKKMKVSGSTGKDGETEMIVMDGEGKIITSDTKGREKVVVKHLKPGDKMDPEIEKIIKENGFNYEFSTEDGKATAHKIVIKNSDNKNGKQSNDVKVYVFSKVEVKTLSDADKKQLPADASKEIQNAKPFDNLTVAPNPTEDACTITYKSNSKEPLQIKVYNMEGKTVLTESDTSVGEQVTKTISLKELGKGVYFVHITQGKNSEVRKVIVK
ncbi:MAG TPA: T9SS type A sorting domain-containing protein [Bacteroidia bacterium]|jgi:hypothetical protein|nr:T9SS type A sorting domain-containing protein [Bacteroidia bacterium]